VAQHDYAAAASDLSIRFGESYRRLSLAYALDAYAEVPLKLGGAAAR
jgi:hypothetical protein